MALLVMLRGLELKFIAHVLRDLSSARSVDLITLKRPELGIIVILSLLMKMWGL